MQTQSFMVNHHHHHHHTLRTRRSFAVRFAALAGLAIAAAAQATEPRAAQIINERLETESVRIIAITETALHLDIGGGQQRTMPLSESLAIIFDDAPLTEERGAARELPSRHELSSGLLLITDGQRFVGTLDWDREQDAEKVAWTHPLTGRLEFSLDEVHSVALEPGSQPAPTAQADVVRLTNGDELEGFVLSLRDPISIELIGSDVGDDARIVDLPLGRVASVSIIAPNQPARGMRLWLIDGSIMSVESVVMREDGMIEIVNNRFSSDNKTREVPRRRLSAMLTDARRIVPLSTLPPTRVEGPPTRYVIPDPVVLDDSALLGAGRIEYRGPMTVHYALPPGAVRFAAEAVLPPMSREWGDFDLIIRVDGSEIERRTINAAQPDANINLAISGSELTIELREGESGPIQNHLILYRPLLLVER
jgi:hypothetical protein